MNKPKNDHPGPPLPAPAHLSERSKALWAEIVALGKVRSVGRPILLQMALECLDRADEARQILAKEGLTQTTKRTGAIHVHPLARVERESRQIFAKLWSQLGLKWDPFVDGRISQ